MWKVLWLLGVLAGPLKSHHLPRRGIRGMNDREIFEKVHYSFSVPIWQHSPADNFNCEQPGYFPDPLHCQYFYKCTEGQPHLFRFVYRCEEDRIYSADTNSCLPPTENNRECIEKPDSDSMEDQDKQAESNQQTSDEMSVEDPSPQNDVVKEGEEKPTPVQDLTGQNDESAVNAPTQKSTSLFSIHTPDIMKLPKLELNMSVERGAGFEGIKNTGLKLLKGQLFDNGKEDQDNVPVQYTPPSIPAQQTTLPTISEGQTTLPTISEGQTTLPTILEGQTTLPTIPEGQTTLSPIPEMESDEQNEEDPNAVIPISTTTFPTTSEAEEDRTTTPEVQTDQGQPTPAISTTFHWPEDPAANAWKGADQNVCHDGKNSSDCVDEGFYGYPEDCSKFYRCVSFGSHFVKYELQCPLGSLWDDSLKTCNFRAAIKEITCTDKSLPVTSTTPTSTTATASTTPASAADDSDPDCPFEDIPDDRTGIICPTGFRQHPKYCNMFYQCISSDNFEMNFTSLVCPEGMVFNMELLKCEENATMRMGCKIFEPEEQDDGRILIHSNVELCPKEGRFIYGEHCSSHYIECQLDENGELEGYLFSCPPGKLYSRVRDRCRSSSYFHYCTL